MVWCAEISPYENTYVRAGCSKCATIGCFFSFFLSVLVCKHVRMHSNYAKGNNKKRINYHMLHVLRIS